MASIPESNYIGNFVTIGQYLKSDNSIGNGDNGGVIPTFDNFLLEDGFNFLLEDGVSLLLLE